MDAAAKIDMATTCYYTFSTLCQALAGAYGFLVAVVLYRLKENADEIRDGIYYAKLGRGLDNNPDFMGAVEERDWPRVANTLRDANLTDSVGHFSEQAKMRLGRQRDRFVFLVDQVTFMRRGLRHTLTLTGWTIFLSFGLLVISQFVAKTGHFAWVVLAVAWLAVGACLITYYDLAKTVAE